MRLLSTNRSQVDLEFECCIIYLSPVIALALLLHSARSFFSMCHSWKYEIMQKRLSVIITFGCGKYLNIKIVLSKFKNKFRLFWYILWGFFIPFFFIFWGLINDINAWHWHAKNCHMQQRNSAFLFWFGIKILSRFLFFSFAEENFKKTYLAGKPLR